MTARGDPLEEGRGPVLGRVRRRGWRRVSHGLYVPDSNFSGQAGLPPERTPTRPRGMSASYETSTPRSTDRMELRGWAMVLPPGGLFTHLTAAAIRRWWLPPCPHNLPVFAAVPDAGWRPRRVGLHVTRFTSTVPGQPVDGLPVAAPAEILLAAARHLALVDLVVLADGALHLGDVTIEQLTAIARGRRGGPLLCRAIQMMDGRSESPGETLLRLMHVTCGVPVEVQARILDEYEQTVARADLRIVGTKRLAEYDGAHHRDLRQYERDRARERRLQELGWQRYAYSATTTIRQPHLIIRDADHALDRRHDPARLDAWFPLIQTSTFTDSGMAGLRARLGLPDRPWPR